MKILSVIAQKPYATGSGVYLSELVREFQKMNHTKAIICGIDYEVHMKIDNSLEKVIIRPNERKHIRARVDKSFSNGG